MFKIPHCYVLKVFLACLKIYYWNLIHQIRFIRRTATLAIKHKFPVNDIPNLGELFEHVVLCINRNTNFYKSKYTNFSTLHKITFTHVSLSSFKSMVSKKI